MEIMSSHYSEFLRFDSFFCVPLYWGENGRLKNEG